MSIWVPETSIQAEKMSTELDKNILDLTNGMRDKPSVEPPFEASSPRHDLRRPIANILIKEMMPREELTH